MKTLWIVAGNDIKYKNDDESLVKLSNEDILNVLNAKEEAGSEEDIELKASAEGEEASSEADAKEQKIDRLAFDSYESAKAIALYEQDKHPKEALIIYAAVVEDDAELNEVNVDVNLNVIPKPKAAKKGQKSKDVEPQENVFKAFWVSADSLKFVYGSLKHVDEKIEDFVLDADLYKQIKPVAPQTARINLLDLFKKSSPLLLGASVGAGFWQSGAAATVAKLLSTTLGVALPTAGVAALAVEGLIVLGLVGATYAAAKFIASPIFNALSTAWANRSKTDKQLDDERADALAKEVDAVENELGYGEGHKIRAKFAELFAKAPKPVYEADGKLAAQDKQPGLNALQVLEKEKARLAELKAANDAKDDAKKIELEAAILKRGFKFSSK